MNITPDLIQELAASNVNMTPEQALKALDDAAAEFVGKRRAHNILTSATRILRAVVQQNERLVADANKAAEEKAAEEKAAEEKAAEEKAAEEKAAETDGADEPKVGEDTAADEGADSADAG